MASEEDMPGCSNSSPAASPSQEVLAMLLASLQSPTCPICQETITDEACVSWCRHVFCFACIMKEANVKTVCPVCQGSFQTIFHKVGVDEYEVHRVVPDRRRRRRLSLRPFPESRQRASSDTLQDESSDKEESSGQAGTSEQDQSRAPVQDQSGAPEQDQSRAAEQHQSRVLEQHQSGATEQDQSRTPEQQQQDGHSRDQQAPRYNTRRSRRQPQTRPPRPQRAIPEALVRRQQQQRAGQDFSTEQHETRSRSQRRSHSRRGQAGQEHSGGQRSGQQGGATEPHNAPYAYGSRSCRRGREEPRVGPGTARHQWQSRRGGAESPAPRVQRHVPASSEQAHNRQRHAPASSGRRECRQQGGRNPSRQGRAARN